LICEGNALDGLISTWLDEDFGIWFAKIKEGDYTEGTPDNVPGFWFYHAGHPDKIQPQMLSSIVHDNQ
jgi:hypothetical protein